MWCLVSSCRPVIESTEVLWQYTVLVLNLPVACGHDKPANTPSTASSVPCEIHPAHKLSITLVGNPTEGELHH